MKATMFCENRSSRRLLRGAITLDSRDYDAACPQRELSELGKKGLVA